MKNNQKMSLDEIERYMEEETIEDFETFVLIEKQEDFEKNAIKRLHEMKGDYLIVEHPHQMPKSIYVFSDYDDNTIYSYTDNFNKDVDIKTSDEELLVIALGLDDLNSYQIYSKQDVLECDSFEEFIEKVYSGQSYHNKFTKGDETFVSECEYFYNKIKELDKIGK